MKTKFCKTCGSEFQAIKNRRYCSVECHRVVKRCYQRERMRRLRQEEEYRKMDQERVRVYYRENRDKRKIIERRRKHRELDLPATLTHTEWLEILEFYGNKCAYCGAEGELHQEHVIPVSKGGGYTKDNIVPACPECNVDKSDKDLLLWVFENGNVEVSVLQQLEFVT